jgi:lysyl-tRNA synthetase class 2
MNKGLIEARSRIVKLVREYFDREGFLELHTPRLVGLPGQEPYLEPMWSNISEQNGTTHRGALITSPEYAMKRMLASGFERIYDLGPCFRNGEPWDGTHDQEFLMLEWYEKGIGLSELMDRTEAMVKFVAEQYGKPMIGAFRRLTVAEAMKQYAGVDLLSVLDDREAMARIAVAHGQTVTETDTWDDLFFKVFLSEVEPKLGEMPTFLTHYPASMAALAQKDTVDPRLALRTELYIGELELANGFAELADVDEQRKRFEEEQALRKSLGKDIWPIDERFMDALPKMGEAVGIAFGVDRLVMLLTGAKSISDVMPIPIRERF